MLTSLLALLTTFLLYPQASAGAQSAEISDPQALTALRSAWVAMGGLVPNDSTAQGTISITAGTRTESGTYTLLTRGTTQSSEQIAATYTNQTLIYSNGGSALTVNQTTQSLSMEASQSSQSAVFTLPLLAQLLSTPGIIVQLVGMETVNGASCEHFRTWNSFSSHPKVQFLSDFTTKDFWIDSASGLVKRLSYKIREAGGDAPITIMDVYYDDYRSVSGVLYPFLIHKSWNGTPWATITIQTVEFNTGLTDSNFPIQ
jgi:hypothetical protein